MSTRSRIARLNADGSTTSVYVHFDGYPSGVGQMLLDHYTDQAKIDRLMELGDMSCLKEQIDPPAGVAHSYDRPANDVCLFYDRDRGESDVSANTDPSQAALIEKFEDSDQEFLYLWDGNGWTVRRASDDEDQFVSVKDAISAEESD